LSNSIIATATTIVFGFGLNNLFSAHRVCQRSLKEINTIGAAAVSFYGPDAFPVTQPTPSKHGRNRKNDVMEKVNHFTAL